MNPIGIFAKTFPRPTLAENLDAVRNHRLGAGIITERGLIRPVAEATGRAALAPA